MLGSSSEPQLPGSLRITRAGNWSTMLFCSHYTLIFGSLCALNAFSHYDTFNLCWVYQGKNPLEVEEGRIELEALVTLSLKLLAMRLIQVSRFGTKLDRGWSTENLLKLKSGLGGNITAGEVNDYTMERTRDLMLWVIYFRSRDKAQILGCHGIETSTWSRGCHELFTWCGSNMSWWLEIRKNN